jgi:hypothetical protein
VSTRKIAEPSPPPSWVRSGRGWVPPCCHPEHNPPSHMVLSPGTYEHTCPGCGRVVLFTVPLITFGPLVCG